MIPNKVRDVEKMIPSEAEAPCFSIVYGVAEATPLQNKFNFTKPVQPAKQIQPGPL
jgi:hypothetical protein